MVDVVSRRCKDESCTKHPSFNHPGAKKGLFCRRHAQDGMVDVVNRRCKDESCTKHPSFNHPGTKKGLFCGLHAQDGMVDVVNQGKQCKHSGGCTTRQSYGYWADGVALFCSNHQDALSADGGLVINYLQKCCTAGVKGCCSVVNWGLPGEQPSHCNKHGALKAAQGFVCIPKQSNKRGRAALPCAPRSTSGGGGMTKKARKARPRPVETSSNESSSSSSSESELESSKDFSSDEDEEDEEDYEGEYESEPEPEVPKKRIIWL